MNDFTKEELEIILNGLLWRDAHIRPSERPEKLKCKIQSIIEKYCEHKWTHATRWTPIEEEILYCIKCRGYFPDSKTCN